MKSFISIIVIILLALVVPIHKSNAQDMDQDGLNDQFEEALANRFAPEWRFNKKWGPSTEGSKQNHNERYFPSSIEWFYGYINEFQGSPPTLTYNGQSASITDISNLDAMIVPGTSLRTDDPSWGTNNAQIKIENYPEKIPGDPNGFPTYYRCYQENGRIGISYFLFYPFDYKGTFTDFNLEFGWHRADWEGINILLTGELNVNDPNSVVNASIERVYYSGHGHAKYMTPGTDFHCVDETHPKVYISWGSHTSYPQPGEWYDWKISWGPFDFNLYDDMFHGDGLIVQSWDEGRNLINLGETENPLVGWLNYRGWWGPDNNGGNASPPGPPSKSFWTHSINNLVTWQESQNNYADYWDRPFNPDCAPHHGVWFDNKRSQVVLFENNNWDGASSLMFNPEHSSIPFISGQVSSVLLLTGATITLYEQEKFGGSSFSVSESLPNLSLYGWNDRARSAMVHFPNGAITTAPCNAYVDWRNNCSENHPYNFSFKTVTEAVDAVPPNRTICIVKGYYDEAPLVINKPLILNAFEGSVIIGN